jgi:hypothetical protein
MLRQRTDHAEVNDSDFTVNRPPASHGERRHFRAKVLTYRDTNPIEMPSAPNVTELLLAWQAGGHAALDKLPAIQPELRRIPRRHMAGERRGHVLQVSVGTVRRDWSLARAWLYRELGDTGRHDTSLDTDGDV